MTAPSTPAGLCATCIHARRIESARGSVFILCARSRDDARFPKYPPLPVLRCIGWQPHPEDASKPRNET
jgi:hypothetical protein